MGLFQHKQSDKKEKSPIVDVFEDEKNFFDDDFREEIKDHARKYFEKTIQENADLFKKDLDAAVVDVSAMLKTQTEEQLKNAIAQVNTELKDYATKKLDERFAEYGNEMKEAQNATLESLKHTAEDLQNQYRELSETLKKNIEEQNNTITTVTQESIDRTKTIKEAQDKALDLVNQSAAALQEQYQQVRTMLQKNVVEQQDMILQSFQDNMAQIVEHYLLGALGDQYDLKSQLPSIIKQMESNKDAIIGDMKL